MNAILAPHALGWLARADFLERMRRASFLLVVGAALWMMWLVYIGTLTVRLGDWRGEFNSAWLGMVLVTIVTVFISLFGFYLVKDPLTRDRATGVGQIIAATPTRTATYLLGKWLSNSLVLVSVLAVCVLAALALQFARGESATVEPLKLLAPVVLLAVPALMWIAALALVFESVPWLRGGFGNVLFFFVWVGGLVGTMEAFGEFSGLDPFGMATLLPALKAQVHALDPSYQGGLLIGGSGSGEAARTFVWQGLTVTPLLVAQRLTVVLFAAGTALLPALWFDRFREPGATASGRAPLDLTRRIRALDHAFDALGMVGAELRMLLGEQRWWWLAVAAVVAVVQLSEPEALVFAWLWPILAWSALGCRAEREGLLPLILSTPRPVLRPILAAWAAGALVVALCGAGTLATRLGAGDAIGVLAFVIACGAIPALALACGASGTPRLFEVLWLCLWYAGIANKLPAADLMRMRAPETLAAWALITALALGAALALRARRR